MRTSIQLLALIITTLVISGCTKKRDAELVYGADRDLYVISEFEGKQFNFETSEITAASDSSKKYSQDTNFGFVSYKSYDPLKLVDGAKVIGKKQSQYKIQYLFEPNLLKVVKVSALEGLSREEKISAQELSKNQWSVPLVSYPIEYYRTDNIRNDYNEKTSKLELIRLNSRTGASHFKIDLNGKRAASFLPKSAT
jgi:hypothetical protein